MRVADNVYAVLGLTHPIGVNTGFVVTERSVVAIDASMTYWSAQTILGYIEVAAKGKSNNRLILTEGHSDHIFGACAFKQKGYTVIAHKKVPEYIQACVEKHGIDYVQLMIKGKNEMAEKAFDKQPQGFRMGETLYSRVELVEPDVLINRETKLIVDTEELQIIPTPGHTETNLCIYLTDSKVLFAGDTLYSGYAPVTRFTTSKLQKRWLESLRRLKSLDISTVIPGHGPPCGKGVIKKHMQHLERLIKSRKCVRTRKTLP